MEGRILIIILLLVDILSCKRLWKQEDIIIGYDFENESELDHITHGKESTGISSNLRKHGDKSLEWNWTKDSHLLLDLTSQISNHSNPHKFCGVHFWLHQSKPVMSHLRVTYYNNRGQSVCIRVNLNFKNWRAVARIIKRPRMFKGAIKVGFEVEDHDPYTKSGTITFDLIRVATRCVGWTYDVVNPPQMAMSLDQRNKIGGIEDLNGVYEINHYWQNMYKWRKVDLHHLEQIKNAETEMDYETMRLWTKQVERIEERVENWYFPAYRNDQSMRSIALDRLYSLFNCNVPGEKIRSRIRIRKWKRRILSGNFPYLRRTKFTSQDADPDVCVRSAYQRYSTLKSHAHLPSLFPSRDVFPHGRDDWTGLKFNEVIHRILFPMSLEYFISKSKNRRKNSILNADPKTVLEKELANDPTLLKKLLSLKTKSLWKAYEAIDRKRLGRLTELFDYLQREGWDDGSGLGNTDHLVNQNWGFTHSLFLLRNDLNSKTKEQLLKTARWYNELGEVHQEKFRYPGTTADKLRNMMISRLLIVLSQSANTEKEARRKFTDLLHLKKWIENALDISEGYGGLIKPDFTGYHHKGPYMTAYHTHALHALSLAAYFLHGTHFQISRERLLNLKEALKTIYVMSNSRAMPLSVSGAKVAYNNVWVNRVMPAYAYLAVALQHPNRTQEVDTDLARFFLKLYKKNDPYLRHTSLLDGKVNDECQYLNSIGSIEVFETVRKLAKQNGIKARSQSPNGHWTKSYASLAVQRRAEWTVTVKGFSKYIWDYESTVDQNVFGRYQSHGHMLIANGRNSFQPLDIFSGYDWNRVAGTTTVELQFDQLKSQEKCRYFTNRTTVGGLTYKNGPRRCKNGIYAMDFEQPEYLDDFFKQNPYSFRFKKSFFFFDSMVICLGSNIYKKGLETKNVVTTLFQNKLIGSSKVQMNLGEKKMEFDKSSIADPFIKQREPITFVDVNKNGYFVPVRNNHVLNIRVGKHSDPRTPNGKRVENPKSYASVAFQHGTTSQNPDGESYEYAVLVDTNSQDIMKFARKMKTRDKPYTVIRQDDVAHVVQFSSEGGIYTGYVIFDHKWFEGKFGSDVIRSVNRSCIAMVKREGRSVTITVSDPDLRMFDDYIPSSRYIRKDLLYNSRSRGEWLAMSFNEDLNLLETKRATYKKVGPGYQSKMALWLSHGVSSEMRFRVMRKKKRKRRRRRKRRDSERAE